MQKPFVFLPHLVKEFESVPAALFLSCLLSTNGDGDIDKEGWVCKTIPKWSEKTGLGEDQVRAAIKTLLSADAIEIKEERLVHKRYIRVKECKET